MIEVPVFKHGPDICLEAASRITAAAIQSGAIDAKDIDAIDNYLEAIYQRLASKLRQR